MTRNIYRDPAINNPADDHYHDPWPTFMRELRDAMEGIPTIPRDPELFPGQNFMADEIVSYHQAGDERIEVSYGRFMDHYTVGLSFRNIHPDVPSYVETFETPQRAADRLRELMA